MSFFHLKITRPLTETHSKQKELSNFNLKTKIIETFFEASDKFSGHIDLLRGF